MFQRVAQVFESTSSYKRGHMRDFFLSFQRAEAKQEIGILKTSFIKNSAERM